ncbi:hypothetical protein LCX93_11065 [Sulfurimonas sp. SWIR-19]|uniref:hypothetical protein n=1 Tax=Sulfurimonas sp. SWIR-19 TaxID=2878390 RepID=UPI001CF1E0A4|nr:hypothetical protein [Sulfurimonas sp. SWIR-19]UCN00055.1 hypothetical protein LCX93_11065 [Sulfurimonas sp. SWIR-19]
MDYLVKVALIIPFGIALHFVIDKFMTYFSSYLHTLPMTSILCQFGIFTGLNLFLSIVISAFFAKQILSFWK